MFFFFYLIPDPAGLILAGITVSLCVAWCMVSSVDRDLVAGGHEKKQRGKLNDHASTK